jgi:hypothetical protein
MDRVHGAVDWQCAWVQGGPRAAWTLGVAVPRRRATRECQGSPVFASGGRGGRARRRGAAGVLTRARTMVVMWCDDGEERRQRKLSVRAEEGERELGSKGERCAVLWVWCLPFTRAGGALGRGGNEQ